MNKQKWSLMGSAGVGVGLGAGLMFLLDPKTGSHRRALARDKTVGALKTGGNAALQTGKDLGNRTRDLVTGAVASGKSRLKGEVEDVLVPAVKDLKNQLEATTGNGRSWKSSKSVLAGTALSAMGLSLLAAGGLVTRNGRKDLRISLP